MIQGYSPRTGLPVGEPVLETPAAGDTASVLAAGCPVIYQDCPPGLLPPGL